MHRPVGFLRALSAFGAAEPGTQASKARVLSLHDILSGSFLGRTNEIPQFTSDVAFLEKRYVDENDYCVCEGKNNAAFLF